MALHGWDAYRRHLRNPGFVPPEFRDHGRVHEDPDALGYTLDLSGTPDVKTMSGEQLQRAFDTVLPPHIQNSIRLAASLAHADDAEGATAARYSGGYGGT